jgi:hypothetical protein
MHKSSFMQMVLGYIPRSEGYNPLFFQGTIVLGTVVPLMHHSGIICHTYNIASLIPFPPPPRGTQNRRPERSCQGRARAAPG